MGGGGGGGCSGERATSTKNSLCVCRENRERVQEREREGGRDCGRATVLLCLPAGLIWSPARLYSSLVSKEFTLTTAALQLIIQDCFL